MAVATQKARQRTVRGGGATATTRWVVLPILVPAVVIGVGGWLHRWMDEDAFINFRIVDQVFAGHGPVFNAGQRVEAFTSPLWLGVLVAGRATLGSFMRIEWVALLAGLIFAVAAFVIGACAARIGRRRDEIVVPIGLLIVAAVPVMWDFASSGLEMSLVWLWLATCWFALVRAANHPELNGRTRVLSSAVLGLGAVIRPELGFMTVSFLVAWFAIARPRRVAYDLAVALAVPVAYEIFRMGYYAMVVPNTGLAKDSGRLYVRQGWNYLYDLLHTYLLWMPLVLIAIVIGLKLRESRDRSLRIVTGAMLTAAGLDTAYIVATGGDYMHGRLLLPALFAVALPASLVLRPHALRTYGILGAGIVWVVACAGWMRYPPPPKIFAVPEIADWRRMMGGALFPTQKQTYVLTGRQARRLYDGGARGYLRLLDTVPRPGKHKGLLVATMGSIGLAGYDAGRQVWIVDIGGLAEPLAARASAIEGRPAGHRKDTDPAWYDAEFGTDPGDSKVMAARHALSCEPLSGLLTAIGSPLTPSRFASNVWHSLSYTFLHVPSNPVTAERELCGTERP
jgi:arabinofuranosyltransferase